MHALPVILIALGAFLAALGTSLFCCVASAAPTQDDLRMPRGMATIGRRMVYAGTLMILIPHPLMATLALVGFCAAASHLTRAPLRHVARGAAT